MVVNSGDDGISAALARLTGCMGLYWALYSPEGDRVGGAMPPALPACAGADRCALLSARGTCPAAVSAPVPAAEPVVVTACLGTPTQRPGEEIVQALAEAFECQSRASEDVEATVRELTSTYQELAIAYGIMETISLPTSQEAMAQALLAHVASAAAADGCCLLRLDDTQCIHPLAVENVSAEEIQAVWRCLVPHATKLPEAGEPFVVPVRGRQVLVSGLQRDDRWSGVVALARDAERPFTSREAKLVQAAGRQAALALRNRSLVDDLRDMFMNTIRALVTAIEIKDAYTCGHSRRVAQSARGTAALLGLPETEVEAVYLAGIVHDVGKIAVEQTVLCKPGPLTEEEWEAVRSHPEHGAGIINCISQLQHLVAGVRHHHERADGGGYPYGLRGEQIPLASQIIAVCDSYDAMTSQRSYRPALASQAAIVELRNCIGTQFSGPAVEAFVKSQSMDAQVM